MIADTAIDTSQREIDLFDICLIIEFALIIFVPTTYSLIKFVFLVPIFLISIFKLKCIKITAGFQFIIFYSIVNLGYMLYGYFNDNIGALKIITVDILYPFLFLVLGQVFPEKKHIYGFITVLFYGTLVIAAYDFIFIIAASFGLTFFLDGVFSVIDTGIHAGAPVLGPLVAYNSYHVEFFTFSIPFLLMLSLRLDCLIREKILPSKRLFFITLLVSVITALLSSNRALIITTFFSILFIIFLNIRKVCFNKIFVFFVILILLFVPFVIYYEKITLFATTLFQSIDEAIFYRELSSYSSTSSEFLRNAQRTVLINNWLEKPLFGFGSGAVAPEMIRSYEQPWSYELSYYALLFQKGMFGFIVFFCISLITLIRMMKKSDYLWFTQAIALGYICFLIGNSINPYMQKFGFIWVYFFPIIVCDYIDCNRNVFSIILQKNKLSISKAVP